MNAIKRCQKCKDTKPLSEFNKDKSRGDGYAYTCRDCVHGYQQDHYKRNRTYIQYKALRKKRIVFTDILHDEGVITKGQHTKILSWLHSGG